jgi:hypothetical protein
MNDERPPALKDEHEALGALLDYIGFIINLKGVSPNQEEKSILLQALSIHTKEDLKRRNLRSGVL